jgi:hypothetical protein
VSPAVRDLLGLTHVAHTRWRFVNAGQVPAGPWTQVVTMDHVFFAGTEAEGRSSLCVLRSRETNLPAGTC